MTETLIVHTDQQLTPRAGEVIRGILDSVTSVGAVKFELFNQFIHSGENVLVLGRGPLSAGNNNKFIYTYSIAQIMSKPNAVTVVSAAMRMALRITHKVEAAGEPRAIWAGELTNDRLAGSIPGGIKYYKPITVDIETNGNLSKTHTVEDVEPISVSFYQDHWPSPVTVLSEYHDRSALISNKAYELRSPLSYRDISHIAKFLAPFDTTVWHNGKFDTRVLNNYARRISGEPLPQFTVGFDTMLAHHVLNQAAGMHGLKDLAKYYLGAPDWEEGISKHTINGGHYDNIPRRLLVQYNGWDVYWTMELYKLLAPQIESDTNAQSAFMLEMSAAEMLREVEAYGIPFDTEYAKGYGFSLASDMGKVLGEIAEVAGASLNPNSPKQVKDFHTRHNITLVSTDSETLQTLIQDVNQPKKVRDVDRLILKYRKLRKIEGTYARGWSKHERKGRVHPTFLVHGTTTGRLSSTSPNAQNMPRNKQIRKLVTITDA